MTFSGGVKTGQGQGVSGRHPQSAKEIHVCTVGFEPGLAKDGSQGSPPSFKSMAFSTTSRAAGIAVEGGWGLCGGDTAPLPQHELSEPADRGEATTLRVPLNRANTQAHVP